MDKIVIYVCEKCGYAYGCIHYRQFSFCKLCKNNKACIAENEAGKLYGFCQDCIWLEVIMISDCDQCTKSKFCRPDKILHDCTHFDPVNEICCFNCKYKMQCEEHIMVYDCQHFEYRIDYVKKKKAWKKVPKKKKAKKVHRKEIQRAFSLWISNVANSESIN